MMDMSSVFALLDIIMVISFLWGIRLLITKRYSDSIHSFVMSWAMSLGLTLIALSTDDWATIIYPAICLGINSFLIYRLEQGNWDKPLQ